MSISDITNNLYYEDRALCMVRCETAMSTVNDVLAGRRNRHTKLGQAIMAELERLARINIEAKKKKQQLSNTKTKAA